MHRNFVAVSHAPVLLPQIVDDIPNEEGDRGDVRVWPGFEDHVVEMEERVCLLKRKKEQES